MNLENLHPNKTMVTLAEMQAAIDSGNYLCQRKYDGQFSTLKIAGATILAEFMRGEISGHFYTASDRRMFKRFPQGWYAAITVAEIDGKNMLADSTFNRWGYCRAFSADFPPNIILAETITDAADCMAAGAEGVVAHAWGDSWGNMLAFKRGEIHLVRVTGHCGGTQSVYIADEQTGQARGKVTLRGGKCDQVRTGSLIRVECMGVTDKGLLRQPQPCREWLVKV